MTREIKGDERAWAGNGFSVIVNFAVLPHNRYTVMSRPGEGAARSSDSTKRSMGRQTKMFATLDSGKAFLFISKISLISPKKVFFPQA